MAWPRHPFVNAVVDLDSPLPAFTVPPFDPYERAPEPPFKYPEDQWKKGARDKAVFGSKGVELSIYQARRRKLGVWSPLFKAFVRTKPDNRRAEDHLLAAYTKKQAAKAHTS